MSLRIGNEIIPNIIVRVSNSGLVNYQTKTINPSTSIQNIVADSGYEALSKVTVNAIQTETKTVTTNGIVTPSSGKYLTSVTVNVPTGTTINNQNKTVTPTTSQQSITADSGYTGLGTVTVNRIPTNYLIPSGNKSITANGTNIDVAAYSTVSVSVSSTINNQNKTVTPTTSQQTINADSGYSGLGTVTVNRIPTNYIIPSGNKAITANGTNIDVTQYATVSVSVASGTTINNQNKTVTPSTSQQSITADSGYTGLGTVTVNAMPSGTTTSPTSISGTSATVSTGTNTLTLTKTISVTPRVTTAGYVSAGTAGNSSVSLTASITTKAAATITPGTSNQTIAAGTYLTGAQTIVGDADLKASNIVSGVQIFGVTGNVVLQHFYTGTSAPSSSLGSNGDIYLQA